jgi:two-component system cell cycle sensor histidine kinase/response regulator CckA
MEASQAPSSELPERDAFPSQRCILVVDDERTVLSVTARMLAGAGYSVLEATGAREALQLLAQDPSRVDLVLTDVVMPETDGRALGRLIGERHPGIQIAYMSAYPAEDVLHRGSPGPTFTFLRKPFSAEALLAAVTPLIGA